MRTGESDRGCEGSAAACARNQNLNSELPAQVAPSCQQTTADLPLRSHQFTLEARVARKPFLSTPPQTRPVPKLDEAPPGPLPASAWHPPLSTQPLRKMPHSALSSSEDIPIYSDPLSSGYNYDTRRDSVDSLGYDPTDIDSRRQSRIGSFAHYNQPNNVSVDSITQFTRHTPQHSLLSSQTPTYPPSTSAAPFASHSAPSSLSPSQPTPHTPTRRSRARAFSFLQPQTPTLTNPPYPADDHLNPFETDDYATAFELGPDDDDDGQGDVSYAAAEVGAGGRRYRSSFQRLSQKEMGWMMASGGVVLGLAGVAVVLVSV